MGALENLRSAAVLTLVRTAFSLLRRTWRIDEVYDERAAAWMSDPAAPKIVAHFHEDEWALIANYAHRRMCVLVSKSEDGSIMARLLESIGYVVAGRGSSTRGGVGGLLGMIRNIRGSGSSLVSFAVDGPKGPRRQPKPGVFLAAQTLPSNIVAVAAHADRAWVFGKSWSHAFIPKPFARVRVRGLAYDGPGLVKKGEGGDEAPAALAARILAAKSLARS